MTLELEPDFEVVDVYEDEEVLEDLVEEVLELVLDFEVVDI